MRRLPVVITFLLCIALMSCCAPVSEGEVPPPVVPEELLVTFTPGASKPPERTPPTAPPPVVTQEPSSPDTTQPAATQPPATVQTARPQNPSTNVPSAQTAAPATQPPSTPPKTGPVASIGDVTFLGDSTTYGLKAYSMLSGGKQTKQVWTPASGTLALFNQSFATIVYPDTGEEISIRKAAELAKPRLLIITLGVNGVSTMNESDFKADYGDLIEGIQKASPNTVIVLQSIFPVASNYEHLKQINNDKIKAANVWVKAIADDYSLTYIDTYSKLAGSDGWLPSKIQNGDGLHLNSDGFDIVLDNICNEMGISR